MIKPTGSRLFVEPTPPKDKTKSGFVLSPEWNAAPESVEGKVLAIGPDVRFVKVGDVILAPQFAPTKAIENPGEKTFIIPEEDVIAVVTNE